MAYIKKLKYNELVGGTDNTDVYPVTSTEAVYGPDNINQQAVNEDRLRRIELLENNVQSLDGLKEMVEAFISGDDYQRGLSDNNFTDELKAKLDGLENYNDAELRQLLADINTAKANAEDVYTKSEIDDKLGDIQGALTFDNTPIAGSDNPVKSSGIYTALQGKQDTINDLNDIRTHASEFSNSPAASITSTNINSWNQAAEGGGTITGITMNGSSKGTSGVVDLGTVVTQEADPTVPSWAKAASKPSYTAAEVGALPSDTPLFSGDYEDLTNKPTIPSAVTESTVSGWGFTKNTGTITGITMNGASKGTSGVVNLGTVITEHQDISGKANSADVYTKAQLDALLDAKQDTINDLATIRSGASAGATAYQIPSAGIPKSDLSTGVQSSLNKADTALQSYTETDPVFSASPAAGITSNDITEWDSKAEPTTVVNHGTSDTTFALTPNVLHIWGEVTSLTLTLATPADASKLSEYMFEFQSGATPTTLSLPSSVKWVETPTIEANKTYQVSIVNDIAIIVGV